MTLEKLVKQGKALVAGLAFAMAASGCIFIDARKSDSSPADSAPATTYPKTEVQANFGDGLSGKVNYEVCGEVPFNQINYTINGVPYTISFNDAEMVDKGSLSRCFYKEEDIVDGENSMTAVADENPNLAENGSYKFTPATEEEARAKIDEFLNSRGYSYLSDTGIVDGSIPPKTIVSKIDRLVDITRNSQGFLVINFTSYDDDFAQVKIDKQMEDNNNIENYNYAYLSSDELSIKLSQIPK